MTTGQGRFNFIGKRSGESPEPVLSANRLRPAFAETCGRVLPVTSKPPGPLQDSEHHDALPRFHHGGGVAACSSRMKRFCQAPYAAMRFESVKSVIETKFDF
jgi:hypothetical protein